MSLRISLSQAGRHPCEQPGSPTPACQGCDDPEIFFPLSKVDPVTAQARAVCARCPLLRKCAAWALPITNLDGVWGGLTPHDRDHWRHRQMAGEAR